MGGAGVSIDERGGEHARQFADRSHALDDIVFGQCFEVMTSLPAAEPPWISTPGMAASASRTASRFSGLTWTTRLETCCSASAAVARTRPVRRSLRVGT